MNNSKYAALFEDEDDLFLGSPQSKFMDIIFHANENLAKEELENIITKMAAMEIMLEEHVGPEWDDKLPSRDYARQDEVAEVAKSLYVEYTGAILSRNE